MSQDAGYYLKVGTEAMPIEGSLRIGRAEGCELILDDPIISREHALMRVEGGHCFVEDLGSRNGVLVNGTKINGEKALYHGDRITIGSHHLIVLLSRVGPPGEMRQPRPDELPAHSNKTQGATVFEMFLSSCRRVLEAGDIPSAESIIDNLFATLRGSVLRQRLPDSTVVDGAIELGLELTERTLNVRWLQRVFVLVSTTGTVLGDPHLDRIDKLVRMIGAVPTEAIHSYVDVLRTQASSDPVARSAAARLAVLVGGQ